MHGLGYTGADWSRIDVRAYVRVVQSQEAGMFGGRSSDEWIEQYSRSHQNAFNLLCHTLGIPMIAVSLPLFVAAYFIGGLWPVAAALFVAGWVFQFAGHAVEGTRPEFFSDWRFLLVGLRWWVAKVQGRA